jgi:hypothetical protein
MSILMAGIERGIEIAAEERSAAADRRAADAERRAAEAERRAAETTSAAAEELRSRGVSEAEIAAVVRRITRQD